MPLHPRAQELVDALARMPSLDTMPVDEARAWIKLVSGPGARVEGVARVENLTVPGPGGDIPVRLYVPEGTPPFPAVVYFHGGGWTICDLDTHDDVGRSLAARAGAAVVSVDYRLAPEHKFPAAPDDAYAATAWLAARGAEWGIDGSRLAVAGDSAGGNLAAVVCLMARERGGPGLRFQLLVYPATRYDLDSPSYEEHGEDGLLTRSHMAWFWGHYLARPEDGRHPWASPLSAPDLSGLPPALVITAEYDPLCAEGEAYAERLREAGVAVDAVRYDGMPHSFFSMIDVFDDCLDAHDRAAKALREALA